MKVHIPHPLRPYTGERRLVEAQGETLEEALDGLDHRYPGIRFRIVNEQAAIREHIKIFVNGEQARQLQVPLHPEDELHILCAISGG